ncbi:MAG: beta-ketoacyl-[acyl-carrier-protein] synthase family protein [Thermodesulfovibrionales bacterium]|nr:beta-ketoacyl-[acyl-carrier-protein] synthase family protein [Thermodesulfovibrionales bacterium]
MTKKRVFITGLGIVTSLGLGIDKNWASLINGRSGIKDISDKFKDCPISIAGKIDDDDIEAMMNIFPNESHSEGEMRTLFALWSAREALENSNLSKYDLSKTSVSFATGLGINNLTDVSRWIKDKTFDYERFYKEFEMISKDSIVKNNSHRTPSVIANKFGLGGKNLTISTACASATQAIGIAYRMIQRGDTPIVLAGASESMINPVGLIFFVLLGAASTSKDLTSCRPFDKKRSGLVMGEGAAFLVLESEESALKRKAPIICECSGYGSSIDAYQVTAPEPEGKGAFMSMKKAIQDSQLEITDIDYINAHGTSTKLNDLAETVAIKELFGENAYKIKISSSKATIGHLLSASGAPEAVFTALSVKNNIAPPTINLTNADPKCDLDYTANKSISINIKAALSNSFGFGGQNGTIVLKKA